MKEKEEFKEKLETTEGQVNGCMIISQHAVCIYIHISCTYICVYVHTYICKVDSIIMHAVCVQLIQIPHSINYIYYSICTLSNTIFPQINTTRQVVAT